jgi:S-adenosylmethionine:tRNA ribosyltransferase-isomerase
MSLAEQRILGIRFTNRTQTGTAGFDFRLPPALEAHEPPEARGLARDQVRLMVSYYQRDQFTHAIFKDLSQFLDPGDVLVINTSQTLKAALDAWREDGTRLKLHLSTHLRPNLWMVELRQPTGKGTGPFQGSYPGEKYHLLAGGSATLIAPHDLQLQSHQKRATQRVRLWKAKLDLPIHFDEYLERFGTPIQYPYLHQEWPITYYQTVYATEKGSAEMPSAGRPFTPELITQLVAKGVDFAPLILHTGVASLEANEAPYEEYYRIPEETTTKINNAKSRGKRILAVGTTSARAIETVADKNGRVHPREGWTDLIITPQRGIRVIDSLLTGFHEPRASHLSILAALAGERHLHLAYMEAIKEKYLWHEFGDMNLLLR